MYALVIGAGSDSVHAIKVAKEKGLKVIAFDGNKEAEGLKYADEAYVVDIRKPELIIELLKGRIPELVIPVPIGRLLTTAGAINDHFKLKGFTKTAADICTDKYKFHNLLNQDFQRNAECILVKAGEKPTDIAIDYPVIVKPRFGAGSRLVSMAWNSEELGRNFLSHCPFDEDFIIETAWVGTEYGVDGAVIDGQFQLILLREKIITPSPVRQCTGYYSLIRDLDTERLFTEVMAKMTNVVQIIGLNQCLIHADIIYNSSDVFVIELSPRPSGHYLHNVFVPLATGIDMVSNYIDFALESTGTSDRPDFKPLLTRKLLIRYFKFENCTVRTKPNETDLFNTYPLIRYKCNIGNEVMNAVIDGHSLMNRGYFILEGKDKDELYTNSEALLNEFVIN
jgi:biotin carboxylase